ncbi:MAG: tRNA(Met) cytidine acetyltransferase, partial [Colwellia sp.]
MVQVQDFLSWFNDYVKEALANNERRLVVLSGCESWVLSLLHTIDGVKMALNTDAEKDFQTSALTAQCLIYGDSIVFPANVQKKRYRDKLGSESDLIIFADSEFTIDAFAALSGTLRAGGIFFLVLPSLHDKSERNFFFKRFYSLIKGMSSHKIITELQTSLLANNSDLSREVKVPATSTYPLGCITDEQYCAVKA